MADPTPLLSEDERLAESSKQRRFGYLVLVSAALLTAMTLLSFAWTGEPMLLLVFVVVIYQVYIAFKQFALARKI